MGKAVENLEVKLASVKVKPSLRRTPGGKIVPVKGYTRFLGNDKNGNDIEVGGTAHIEAGPDKGATGAIKGAVKGGGIQIEIGSGLQKRTVLAQPDEIRVTRKAKA